MVALAGMLLLPNTIYRSIGVGAILVVIVAVSASLTLLPALLALMGDKIEALRIRGRRKGTRPGGSRFWDRITGRVMRRPVISMALAVGVLAVAALPYLSINEGFSGVSTLPDEVESKRAFLILESEFSGGLGSPVEIVVDGDITSSVTASIDDLRAALATDPSFGPSAVEVNGAGDLALVSAPLSGDIAGDEALDAVRELRTEIVPRSFDDLTVEVLVGGDTAYNLDYLDQTTRYMPIVFLFVLGLTFVLLTVAFRSVVIPVKAIAMNLLSVGAAFGLVVLFFQRGVGPELFKDVAGWLGFGQVEAIEAGLPLFIFAILFGLSMDYHVFLLSRIRERFDRTGDNSESVAYGLRTTGALITGAAAIMVAVFAGFAAGSLVALQQMGFGLAVAVALDATLVRSVLVPATMKLLGDRNWYLPSWLEWLPGPQGRGCRNARDGCRTRRTRARAGSGWVIQTRARGDAAASLRHVYPGLLGHGDDDLPSSLSRFQIADRLGNLAQRERPVDDRRDLPGFDELLQDDQAVSGVLGAAEGMQLAHERRRSPSA